MGQSSLLLVLLAVVTVGVISYTTQQTNRLGTTAVSVAQADERGREAALIGLERMTHALTQRPLDWSDRATFTIAPTDVNGVTYSADIVDYRHVHGPANPAPAVEASMVLDDTVTVEARGTVVDGRTGDPREYLIRATYVKGLTDVGLGAPSRMAFASDQTLRINGANQVLQGTANPANVHANNTLDVQGASSQLRIEGTGSYAVDGSRTDPIHFHPPTRPDGTVPPKVQPVSAVPFIPTDFSNLSRFAGADAITNGGGGGRGRGRGGGGGGYDVPNTGSVNLERDGWEQNQSGTRITGAGTPTNPFQWFINDNVSLRGNSDLRFFRNGTNAFGKPNQAHVEIYVNGDLTLGGGGGPSTGMIAPTSAVVPDDRAASTTVRNWIAEHLPEGVSLWFYVNGNVTLNGNVGLVARIKTNGRFRVNGGGNKTNLIGGVEAIDDIRLNGRAKVYATPPASSGTEPSLNYQVPEGIHLIAYVEWLEGDLPDAAEAP